MEGNELLTLLGGETIDVTDRKGEITQVRVRELRVSEFEKLFRVIDDEEKAAAIYCDQTAEWAANLSTQSLEAVINKAEALNMDPFGRWVERRAKRTTRVGIALGTIKPTNGDS